HFHDDTAPVIMMSSTTAVKDGYIPEVQPCTVPRLDMAQTPDMIAAKIRTALREQIPRLPTRGPGGGAPSLARGGSQQALCGGRVMVEASGTAADVGEATKVGGSVVVVHSTDTTTALVTPPAAAPTTPATPTTSVSNHASSQTANTTRAINASGSSGDSVNNKIESKAPSSDTIKNGETSRTPAHSSVPPVGGTSAAPAAVSSTPPLKLPSSAAHHRRRLSVEPPASASSAGAGTTASSAATTSPGTAGYASAPATPAPHPKGPAQHAMSAIASFSAYPAVLLSMMTSAASSSSSSSTTSSSQQLQQSQKQSPRAHPGTLLRSVSPIQPPLKTPDAGTRPTSPLGSPPPDRTPFFGGGGGSGLAPPELGGGLGSPPSRPSSALSGKPADAVVFVVHGIGNQIEGSMMGKYATSIANLRNCCREVGREEFGGGNGGDAFDVDIIPIEWHSVLHALDSTARRMHLISLPTAPVFRQINNDVLSDILFFFSCFHGPQVLAIVADLLNAAHDRYRRENPTFRGPVALLGHSLGGIICYDILANQVGNPVFADPASAAATVASDAAAPPLSPPPTPDEVFPNHTRVRSALRVPHDKTHFEIEYPTLRFRPDILFSMGSPISGVLVFRGQSPSTYSLPAGIKYYNIFHFFDPLAYRIEPLFDPAFADVPPVLLQRPSYTTARMRRRIQRAFDSTWKESRNYFTRVTIVHSLRSRLSMTSTPVIASRQSGPTSPDKESAVFAGLPSSGVPPEAGALSDSELVGPSPRSSFWLSSPGPSPLQGANAAVSTPPSSSGTRPALRRATSALLGFKSINHWLSRVMAAREPTVAAAAAAESTTVGAEAVVRGEPHRAPRAPHPRAVSARAATAPVFPSLFLGVGGRRRPVGVRGGGVVGATDEPADDAAATAAEVEAAAVAGSVAVVAAGLAAAEMVARHRSQAEDDDDGGGGATPPADEDGVGGADVSDDDDDGGGVDINDDDNEYEGTEDEGAEGDFGGDEVTDADDDDGLLAGVFDTDGDYSDAAGDAARMRTVAALRARRRERRRLQRAVAAAAAAAGGPDSVDTTPLATDDERADEETTAVTATEAAPLGAPSSSYLTAVAAAAGAETSPQTSDGGPFLDRVPPRTSSMAAVASATAASTSSSSTSGGATATAPAAMSGSEAAAAGTGGGGEDEAAARKRRRHAAREAARAAAAAAREASTAVDGDDDAGEGAAAAAAAAAALPGGTRVDYFFTESIMDNMISQYLVGMKAHFSYWTNKDMMYFILKRLREERDAST
ncbi:hypothetical protein HK405_006132, partial [Cladochytrium tenue]